MTPQKLNNHYYLLLLIRVVYLFSCGKKPDQTAPLPIINSGTIHVYMSGCGYGNGHWIAKYWKDSIPFILSDSTRDEKATAIFVAGDSDVYVAGYVVESGMPSMKYWINGRSILVNDNDHMQATGIAISNNSIYIAGSVYDVATAKNIAACWKNGSITYLPGRANESNAYAIAVSGKDVYVAWDQRCSNANYTAKYSKNGIAINLYDSSTTSHANSIAVSGNDVYVAGYIVDPATGMPYATYWKNRIPVCLTDKKNSSFASAVFVSGNDIYVSGYVVDPTGIKPLAEYWKNGVPVILGNYASFSIATGIAVSGSDVYVSGLEGCAKYWKNGTVIDLARGTAYEQPSGIFLK